MMYYFAKIERQKDGRFLAEFPELPGCFTEGNSLEQTKSNAFEALNGWLTANCDRDLNIPKAREKKGKNYFPIEVEISVEFVIRLRTLRKNRRMSQSDVAKKLGISQQAYAKLESPAKANPSLSTVKKLSEALNAEIDIRLVA